MVRLDYTLTYTETEAAGVQHRCARDYIPVCVLPRNVAI